MSGRLVTCRSGGAFGLVVRFVELQPNRGSKIYDWEFFLAAFFTEGLSGLAAGC